MRSACGFVCRFVGAHFAIAQLQFSDHSSICGSQFLGFYFRTGLIFFRGILRRVSLLIGFCFCSGSLEAVLSWT